MAYATFNIELAAYVGTANSGTDTKSFTIDDLEPGNYSIFSVYINSCGTIAGKVSNALDITVGLTDPSDPDSPPVIETMPSHNPTNIRIENKEAGEFLLLWDYIKLSAEEINPTVFYIYADDVYIGESSYSSVLSRFDFTTSESYSHNQEIEFTIKSVNDIYIKEPGISITGVADSEGPSITIDSESIELL